MRRTGALLLVGLMGTWGCQGGEAPEAMDGAGDMAAEAEPIRLGPADGLDLPAEDTGRVNVGDPAPDFSLHTFRGDTLTLSEYRGQREIILVFYRGSW